MRAITPASTDPKFIRPSNDLRKALKVVMSSESDRPGPPSKKKAPIVLAAPFVLAKKTRSITTAPTQVSNRNRNNPVEVDSEPSSDGVETLMDLTQDSDEENAKVTKKPQRKMKNGESQLDDVGAFFHPPTFASEKDSKATMFKCRWCHNTYKKARGTRCNLYKHQDGDLTRAACSARNVEAISAGAKLPLTPKEIKDRKMDQQRGAMAQFVQSTAFEAGTFNQILVMWLIRHALPWSQIEDLLLGIAFNYVRQGVKLYSRTWAATEAHNLYCNLQGKVLSILELSLIHDVWTTKGNRQAFLGISAVYISADWVFKIVHLGLKYISWTHKGKYLAIPFVNIITTGSGSKNGTMAAEVDRLIHQKTGIDMNMSENRIRCICHKFALILNAGLKVIAITPKGLVASKESTLGFVPGLSAISEEFHEIEETERFEEEVFIEDDDVDSETDSSSDTEEALGNTNRIDSVLKKVWTFSIHSIFDLILILTCSKYMA
ncbi:hypothetical protein Pst134EA_022434 [Puccinia striiformis f. sp. tritici]|uniref:hypothetical protein n=1 Tax=Puccinia striiformis f. sp. tritici TaxID=168172 RepID=UPI002007C262|nr:hypothetical protein Pst134EA_022434 [Puccinia striiformis f. sp. tritici]KAH9454947.1 hypothetical protein Pst134EA_022434 [Puccinia striiformis f. sp. tritici]